MPLTPQRFFLIAIAIVLAITIVIPIWNPKLFKDTGWVAYAGASIALLGLLTREYFALRAMRKQHTVSILLQSRLSTAFNERAKAMISGYPVMPTLSLVEIGDWVNPAKREALEALKYLLNYYEFIAIGVRTGDLDEDLLRKSLRSIVINLCTLGDAYIQHAQSANPSLFTNLIWLRDRWARDKNMHAISRLKNPIKLNR